MRTKMQLFGLKNCDTCRKAVKSLQSAGFAVELVDLRVQPMDVKLRAAAYAEFGDALVNTRSTTWRGLEEAARARPALELLAEHDALMKRPLIVAEDGTMYLGWTKAVQASLGVA